MTLELDHLFILTTQEAPEGDRLIQSGFTEGTPNQHPGQGTACRRFFIHNAMIELLWVADAQEVQSARIAHTHLWQRWVHRASGACPFGFCFRPLPNAEPRLPFDTWTYQPPYLPPHLQIPIATIAVEELVKTILRRRYRLHPKDLGTA